MQPLRLSYEDFLKSFDLVPRLAVELVIVERGKILYILRQGDPYKGMYHIPGGFLMKNESINMCRDRILSSEVGEVDIKKEEFIEVVENIGADPRGHILHYVLKIELEKPIEPKEGQILSSEVPENIIPYQRVLVEGKV